MTEPENTSIVQFTPAALADLESIWDYVAEDSPLKADRLIETLLESAQGLGDFPKMGHRRTDLADEALRVWPVYSFLIIYRETAGAVEIIRIVSGLRDLSRLFG